MSVPYRFNSEFLKKNSSEFVAYLSYFSLTIYVILYTIFSLTIFELQIFPTINRVTLTDVFVNWSLTGFIEYDIVITISIYFVCLLTTFKKIFSIPISLSLILLIIIPISVDYRNYQEITNITFFITLPILFGLFFIPKIFFKEDKQKKQFQSHEKNYFDLNKFLMSLFVSLIVIEMASVIRLIFYPIFLDPPSDNWSWQFNSLTNNLFYSIGLLSPHLFLLSTVSFILISKRIRLKITNFKLFKVTKKENFSFLQKNLELKNIQKKTYTKKFLIYFERKISAALEHKSQTLFLILIFSIVPSIFLTFYPYAISQIPDNMSLGTDVKLYERWLSELNNSSSFVSGLFIEVADGTRPFTLLVMYSASEFTNLPYLTILKFFPIIVGPIFVAVVYYLVSVLYPENRQLPLLASIMTAASHQIVIGYYSAIYANWLGLIMIFLASVFLIKSLRDTCPDYKKISLFTIFGIMSMFFHSFSWSYFVVIVIFYLIWTFIVKKRTSQSVKIVSILILATVLMISVDLLHSNFLGTSDSFTNDLNNPGTTIGINEFVRQWDNLFNAFSIYFGGFLTNSILLILVFLWIITATYKNDSDRFLLSMFFVSLPIIFFGDFVVQSRIFYNIPLQIPASIIMYKILKNKKFSFGKPLVIFIIFMQFNYALRSMANMNFIT